jgi:hypothetical protein
MLQMFCLNDAKIDRVLHILQYAEKLHPDKHNIG